MRFLYVCVDFIEAGIIIIDEFAKDVLVYSLTALVMLMVHHLCDRRAATAYIIMCVQIFSFTTTTTENSGRIAIITC